LKSVKYGLPSVVKKVITKEQKVEAHLGFLSAVLSHLAAAIPGLIKTLQAATNQCNLIIIIMLPIKP
jgi:hypothetical protein